MVEPLLVQARYLGIPFEICLLDDGSEAVFKEQNAPLAAAAEVRWEALAQNGGRAAARNRLIDLAQGDFLLFLDNDGRILQADFLARYWQEKKAGGILCGGRRYPQSARPETALHWRYGRLREARSAAERQKKPYHGFQSHNFLAHRSVFDTLRFDQAIAHYGHEDTLFGFDLQQMNLPIRHIEAPVEHHDLVSAPVFLDKQARALEGSLDILARRPEAAAFFRLNQWAQKLDRAWWAAPLRYYLIDQREKRKKALLEGATALWLLDLWRLGFLLKRKAEKGA